MTLKDIARAVGKSVAAVSKALHDYEDIAPETRLMIQQAAREMGYKPNVAARRLQKKRSDILGLILPILSARQADPFFTELLSGVADYAAGNGFDLLVSTCAPGSQEEATYQRLVDQGRVDGFIIAQPRRDDWRINFLNNQKTSYIVVGHADPASNRVGVWIDISGGFKQAIDHLAQQGRSKIAFVLPPSELVMAEACLQAFKAALSSHPQVAWQLSTEINSLSQKEGYRAALALLDGAYSVDAVIACHDLVALGVMGAVQDQGFEIGSDIAIVGFGDIFLAEHSQPPLTTLHQPTYAVGQHACRILLDMIAGGAPSPETVVVEPWLVVRQSSGLDLWV